jgi:hypothetical protein
VESFCRMLARSIGSIGSIVSRELGRPMQSGPQARSTLGACQLFGFVSVFLASKLDSSLSASTNVSIRPIAC